VIGAADALGKPACALWRADIDDQVHVAQSMPRSRVEVQTTARSLPATIAASTFRRCATSSEP